MKILRFTKRKKNAPRKGVPISDIGGFSKHTFLDLRHQMQERVPIIEIHIEELLPFFREYRKQLSIIGVALLVFSSFGFIFRSKASVVDFYPSACLGGWQYPKNAEGAPSLSSEDSLEKYSVENSAFLGNSAAQIYCGSFAGEIPKDVLAKQFTLSFRWSVDNGSIVHDVPESVTGVNNSALENTTTNSIDSIPAVEVVPAPATENESVKEQETPAGEQSLLNIFSPEKAHADEGDTSAVTPVENNTEVVPAEIQSAVSEPDTAIQTENTGDSQAPSEGVVTIPENNETEENENSQNAQAVEQNETPLDAFATISYTLNGDTWRTLGYVTQSNWRNTQFDLPLGKWDDLSHVQVSITPLQTLDRQPVVYLDAMQISVSYEDGIAVEKPTVKVKNETSQVIEGDVDFASDEAPVFAIVTPTLTTDELSDLVIDKKAEVVLDKDNVLEIEKKDTTSDENSVQKEESQKVIETLWHRILRILMMPVVLMGSLGLIVLIVLIAFIHKYRKYHSMKNEYYVEKV